jgi:hypothetical protein
MMKRLVLLVSSAVCLLTLLAFLLPSSSAGEPKSKSGFTSTSFDLFPPGIFPLGFGFPPEPEPTPTIYNPYPFGILPADLDSDIARVRREVRGIENEALGQWHALTPPTLTGQPSTLQGTGQRANQFNRADDSKPKRLIRR